MEAEMIAELEKMWGDDLLFENQLQLYNGNEGENEGLLTDSIFGEQLAAFLREDFHHSSSAVFDDSNNLLEYCHFDQSLNENSDHNHALTTMNNAQNHSLDLQDDDNRDHHSDGKNKNINTKEKDSKQEIEEGGSNGKAQEMRPKRRRLPSQVQDHIIAERKRRELLAKQFISLSSIIPGLKKTDKTSVMGEAIKYLQHLKEKVKALEEVAAKYTVQSVVVIKKSKILVDNTNGGDYDRDVNSNNNSSSYINGDDSDNNNNNNARDCLPQIEVKLSNKNLLFRIYCEKQKGILQKLFCQVEKHNMTILHTNIIPFGALAMDVTIVAQMEIGFDNNVKEIIRGLHSALQL